MPLTREERKLLHQKSKQPTFGVNKPDAREGHEGDIAYRRVEGSGTVQYVKENGDWTAIASSGKMPKSRNIITAPSSSRTAIIDHGDLAGLGNDNHTQYLLISGDRAMTGNLDMGSQSIVSVVNVTASGTVQAEQLTSTDDAQIGDDLIVYGDITVDGEAKLDKTTIDTTDGKFTASGANNIELTTTGSNDINLTSGQTLDVGIGVDYELDVTRECIWNTATTTWNNSNTFTLTSVGNVTIETSGADTAKTILLFNDNNHASEDGILIRAEDPTTGTASNIQIRATNHIDLQGGTASISPTGDSITRVKVHGITEIVQLYRPSGSSITTNLETITTPFGGSPETGHTEFEAINTQHLLRAITYKASGTVTNGNTLTIVSNANDDNIAGTVWQISVVYYYSSSKINFQMFYVYFTAAAGSVYNDIVTDVNDTNGGSTAGSLSWDSSNGIRWTNNDSQDAIVKASALRIQSGNDF
jgi:hypothetical protein